jgi:hypothetical protein
VDSVSNKQEIEVMPRLRKAAVAALAALFAPGLFAMDMQNAPTANPAAPGTLNYVEGTATLNGETVTQKSVGTADAVAGQVLATRNGRAEMLLTPGVYLRLAKDSAVRLVSTDLTNTVVQIDRGRADIEVDELFKQNDIHVLVNNVPVQLVQTGLYEFNADNSTVQVFKGKAAVERGDNKWTVIKDKHELSVAEGPGQKPQKFDEGAQETTGLYKWSSLRSEYLAEANQQIAPSYAGYGPGWYWDPYLLNYTFLGMDPFYSPFGWGFYPLGYMGMGMGMGWGGGYYGGGFYGGGGYYGRGYLPNGGRINLPAGGFGGRAVRGGGMNLRGGGFGGGGFHGGGGGFHGGGGGGRR